ncbi:MAG: hypothetical protein MJE66_21945 [Proteobacteria bacterium]|nr:hypothetical protein [Pseudomonadota bacterium]
MSTPDTLAAVLGASVLVANMVLAGRLLWLARRTRELPELLIGLTFLLATPGQCLVGAAQVNHAGLESLSVELLTFGRFLFTVACGTCALAVWRIYRPYGFASLAVMYVVILSLGAGFVNQLLPGPNGQPMRSPLYWMGTAAQFFTFAWAAYEALRTWRSLRHRPHTGWLSTAHRFLLWGVASLCAFGGYAAFVITSELSRRAGPDALGALAVIGPGSILGLAAAACMWFAFLPGAIPRPVPLPESPLT